MASVRSTLLAASATLGLASATVLDLPIIASNGYALVEVEIGTPAKPYRLLFDTGGATSWTVDAHCVEACPNVSGYERVGYSVDASSTGNSTGGYGAIDYMGGNTAGPIVSDVVRVGDFAWTQSFMAANQSSWAAMPSDGLMGFAFNSISVGGADTFMETLMPDLDAPRFGIRYPSDPNVEGVTDGVLTIGASRESELSAGVEEARVPIAGWWGYEVWRTDLMSVTGSVTGSSTRVNCTSSGSKPTETKVDFDYTNAVFDTGSGGIIFPQDKIEDIYRSIGLNWTAILWGDHVMMCDDFNSSWSVTFSFADTMSAAEFPVTLTGDQLARPGFPAAEGACWPPFEPDQFSLLGQLFLRNFYTVWDFGAKQVEEYKPTLGLWRLPKRS